MSKCAVMCKCLEVEWQTKAEDVIVHCHVQMSKSGVTKAEDIKVRCHVQMSKSGVTKAEDVIVHCHVQMSKSGVTDKGWRCQSPLSCADV